MRFRGRRRYAPAVACLAVALCGLVGCGGGSHTSQASRASGTVVDRGTLPGFGPVLVDAKGFSLYMFPPDHARKVTCTGTCAGTWPPLKSSGTPVAGAGVQQKLLGTASSPDGGSVVTYGGWPLYTYVADIDPGATGGQGLDLSGGYWYLMRPDGTPLTPKGIPEPH